MVIAGGAKNPYPVLRTFWREIADMVRKSGIFVYMVSFDSDIRARFLRSLLLSFMFFWFFRSLFGIRMDMLCFFLV